MQDQLQSDFVVAMFVYNFPFHFDELACTDFIYPSHPVMYHVMSHVMALVHIKHSMYTCTGELTYEFLSSKRTHVLHTYSILKVKPGWYVNMPQ